MAESRLDDLLGTRSGLVPITRASVNTAAHLQRCLGSMGAYCQAKLVMLENSNIVGGSLIGAKLTSGTWGLPR
ncbi:unnamed protein product, partial [Iphiclides podalirius]